LPSFSSDPKSLSYMSCWLSFCLCRNSKRNWPCRPVSSKTWIFELWVWWDLIYLSFAFSSKEKVVYEYTRAVNRKWCVSLFSSFSAQFSLYHALNFWNWFVLKIIVLISGKPSIVTFRAYSKDQILKILQQRLLVILTSFISFRLTSKMLI